MHESNLRLYLASVATWGDRALGGAQTADERFVLLVRGDLLARCPDAVIYAVPTASPSEEHHPAFVGHAAPDITYLGFDIGVNEMPGYSVVIQEHPAAPRFGIDAGTAPAASHLPPPAGDACAGPKLGQNI